MSKTEIIQLIKDNLKISITSDCKYCDSGCNVQVALLWGEQKEVISTSEEFIYF